MYLYIAIAILLFWIWKALTKKDILSTIPGPKGLPLLGNVLQLDLDKPHHSVTSFARQYGPIHKLSLLGEPVVVVSGKDALHEMLVTKGADFAGRPVNALADVSTFDYCIMAGGDEVTTTAWHDLKKAIFMHIRGYGAGLKRIEHITVDVINDMIARMKKEDGRDVDLAQAIETVLVNVTYTMLFARKLEDDAERKKILHIGRQDMKIMKPGVSAVWLCTFPWLKHFGNHAYTEVCKNINEKRSLFKKWKEEAFQEEDDGKDSNNFINRIFKLKEDQIPELKEDHVLANTWLLFQAGTLTTSGTLSSLFNILADNPEIQNKLHQEADRVLVDRDVQIEDRNHMPYHQATIFEISRLVPIAPLLLPHTTMRSTSLGGHKIPKDVQVWPNVWAVCHDELLWDHPYLFCPERFLDEDGSLVPADHPHRKRIITFGAGPRVCAGETFAMTRMFLILAQMMKNFEILPAEGQEPFDCRNMVNGIALMAPDFRVKLKIRN